MANYRLSTVYRLTLTPGYRPPLLSANVLKIQDAESTRGYIGLSLGPRNPPGRACTPVPGRTPGRRWSWTASRIERDARPGEPLGHYLTNTRPPALTLQHALSNPPHCSRETWSATLEPDVVLPLHSYLTELWNLQSQDPWPHGLG